MKRKRDWRAEGRLITGMNPHVWHRFQVAQRGMLVSLKRGRRSRNKRRRFFKWARAMKPWTGRLFAFVINGHRL